MHTYKVLVVEDDVVDQRLYRKLLTKLESACFQIQEAHDAQAGLDALVTDKFDCVLLDFSLPGMTGLEFLSAAAIDNELPCAVVLITGQGNEAIAVEAMKRGAQDYLVKDRVNAASLWRAVTQAITQVELRRRLAGSLSELTEANTALEQEAATRRAAETELRAAKNAAEQASEAKTRFLAMMTHELRTPLNGILGCAQLLRIEGTLSPRQDTQVDAIMHAGGHLLSMIDRVLDFASIESGQVVLQLEQITIRDLTDTCIALISPLATERKLGLRVIIAHDAPRQMLADTARLRQVLLNLLSNAVKFTDTGSVELRVLPGAHPGGPRIEIADTGCGINEADRVHLFEDFERLGAATSVEGTGLGLAIAAGFVRLMGGTIEHAPNPAGGSVFSIELPAPASTSAPLPQVAKATLPPPARRILLVDDIKINLEIFCGFLEIGGHEAVVAEGGREAVRLASEQHFDLILMDVRMPDMDGIEAAEHIRKLAAPHGQVPMLALTAYTSHDQIGQCLAAGMDGYVPKPVDYQTLMNAIDDTIARVPVHRIEDNTEPAEGPDDAQPPPTANP